MGDLFSWPVYQLFRLGTQCKKGKAAPPQGLGGGRKKSGLLFKRVGVSGPGQRVCPEMNLCLKVNTLVHFG